MPRSTSSTPPPWQWANLLSLDAPLVAVVWQELLGESFQLPLRVPGRLVLGLTVWAIYLADRILDVRNTQIDAEPARHRFYRHHRRAALWLLLAVVAADLILAVVALRPAVFRGGLLAFAGVALYLVIYHSRSAITRPPKELLVAVLFTAGTFLVAWTWAPNPVQLLTIPALAFFLLCLANLVAIEMWEWRELRGAGSAPPHPITLLLGRGLLIWVPLLAIISVLTADSAWYRAIACSALGVVALVASGTRLSLELRRTLIDAVLLSPLAFLR